MRSKDLPRCRMHAVPQATRYRCLHRWPRRYAETAAWKALERHHGDIAGTHLRELFAQ